MNDVRVSRDDLAAVLFPDAHEPDDIEEAHDRLSRIVNGSLMEEHGAMGWTQALAPEKAEQTGHDDECPATESWSMPCTCNGRKDEKAEQVGRDDELLDEICLTVQREYKMSGLADGLYGDFAKDVARRYAATTHPEAQAVALTFDALRKANSEREEYFVRKVGAGWAFDRLSAWSNATLGELGEAANIVKKIERGDFTLDEARQDLADELADTQIYLDLYARHAGINLGTATVRKWNAVCERHNVPMRINLHPANDDAVRCLQELAEDFRVLAQKSSYSDPDQTADEVDESWRKTMENLRATIPAKYLASQQKGNG